MKLISTKEGLLKNIEKLRQYSSDTGLRREFFCKLITRGHNFVILRTNGITFYAPSRFVGYVGNTMPQHETSARDGRKTDRAIRKILQQKVMKRPGALHKNLLKEFQVFCDSFGITPSKSPKGFWDLDAHKLDISGQRLLDILQKQLKSVNPKDPHTYITYGDAHKILGLKEIHKTTGRDLKYNGLNSLSQWVKENNLPVIMGMIVFKKTRRPGGDFFKLYGKKHNDTNWWKNEIAKSKKYDWGKAVKSISSPPPSKQIYLTKKYTPSKKIVSLKSVEEKLKREVANSLKNHKSRKKRLKKISARTPTLRMAWTPVFDRNPDVIAEALVQARGTCQGCSNKAPFRRKSNGAPYLEVHHKIPLADGGLDEPENAIALCPNCHRERHYGIIIP